MNTNTQQQQAGFPSDDCCSLGQLASGCCNLDIWYNTQFVQNETSNFDSGKSTESHFVPLEHTPVMEGTMTGTLYRGDTAVQTFSVSSSGVFSFTDIGRPVVKAIGGSLKLNTGEVSITWNKRPGQNRMVVSYEYHYESDPFSYMVPRKSVNFKKPTFEKFFTSQELCEMVQSAGTTVAWDFNTALGDTIKEKYESLYVKCHELTAILLRKGAMGYFWLACSPEIASIFETATAGFAPTGYYASVYDNGEEPKNLGVAPLGLPEVTYRGSVNYRWRLYADSEMPKELLLIGCNDTREDPKHYGRMVIHNFII